MSHELSTDLLDQMCILIRGGIEIWIEKDEAEVLMKAIEENKVQRFIRINNQFINVADIQGIFPYESIKEREEKSNETWVCRNQVTHNKREYCHCFD